MSNLSRRKLITTGLAATAGVTGLGVAARLAQKYGLVPPDHGGIYGLGETLTYASQRLLTRHSLAREFSRSQISKPPFANEMPPLNERSSAFRPADSPTGASPSTAWSRSPASFSLAATQELPVAQPDHASGVRRGLVVHSRVDRRASLSRLGHRRGPAASQIRCLLLDRSRLVGKHRHGRCLASADFSRLWHEWR